MREVFALVATAIVSVLACAIVAALIFSLQGCSSKEIVEVRTPVPMVCEYNLTKQPIIRTSTNVELLETLTNLSYDGRMLREDLKSIPCLNIKEVQ